MPYPAELMTTMPPIEFPAAIIEQQTNKSVRERIEKFIRQVNRDKDRLQFSDETYIRAQTNIILDGTTLIN